MKELLGNVLWGLAYLALCLGAYGTYYAIRAIRHRKESRRRDAEVTAFRQRPFEERCAYNYSRRLLRLIQSHCENEPILVSLFHQYLVSHYEGKAQLLGAYPPVDLLLSTIENNHADHFELNQPYGTWQDVLSVTNRDRVRLEFRPLLVLDFLVTFLTFHHMLPARWQEIYKIKSPELSLRMDFTINLLERTQHYSMEVLAAYPVERRRRILRSLLYVLAEAERELKERAENLTNSWSFPDHIWSQEKRTPLGIEQAAPNA